MKPTRFTQSWDVVNYLSYTGQLKVIEHIDKDEAGSCHAQNGPKCAYPHLGTKGVGLCRVTKEGVAGDVRDRQGQGDRKQAQLPVAHQVLAGGPLTTSSQGVVDPNAQRHQQHHTEDHIVHWPQ